MIVVQGSRRNSRERGPIESDKINYARKTMEINVLHLIKSCEENEVQAQSMKSMSEAGVKAYEKRGGAVNG